MSALRDQAVETGASFAPAFQRVSTGDRVFHARFGDGVVDHVTDKGDDQEVTVTFKRHGTKRLMASLANLTVG
jgi:DNA helicase II / ATP-dependent DNA helicase PcrA